MLVVLVNDFNAFYCLLVMVWWGVLLFAMQGTREVGRAYLPLLLNRSFR